MRKIVPLAVAGGVLIASGGAFGGAQAFAKDVELSVDGVPMKVRTYSGSVDKVLELKGIQTTREDQVAPSRDAKVVNGQHIMVRYGRPLTVTIDGKTDKMWTHAITVDEALEELSVRNESKLSASRGTPISREGMELTIDSAKEYTLVKDGQSKPVVTTAKNVKDALNELGIVEGPAYAIAPAMDAPLEEGMTITVSAPENKEHTKTVETDFKTVKKESADLAAGETKVEVQGRKGRVVEVWVDRVVNGQVVESKMTSSRVEAEPVDEVVLVGTGTKKTSAAATTKSSTAEKSSTTPTKSTSTSAPSSSSPSSSAPSKSATKNESTSNSPAVGQTCTASMYDEPQMTATGERFDPSAMTAAHKTLPLNSKLKVTNPKNGKTVIVRINDRGPYVGGRCLDLSKAAFAAIGDVNSGLMSVTIQPL